MKDTFILYTKDKCHLCEKAKKELRKAAESIPFSYEEVDIYRSDELVEKYGLMIPVLMHETAVIQYGQIDYDTIVNFLKNKN